MGEGEKKNKDTFAAKAFSWIALIVFIFSFSFALFLYNLVSVVNEKNIKNIGTKFLSGIIEKNKSSIDPHIDELLQFAKENPMENIDIPTGIQDMNISFPASEMRDLTREDFYEKLPALAINAVYNQNLNTLINDNAKENQMIPKSLLEQLSQEDNRTNTAESSLYILEIIAGISLFVYFIFSNKRKFVFRIGLIIATISFPIYLLFYILAPFITSLIRQLDFVVAGMITESLSKIQTNFLYVMIFGLAMVLVGVILRMDFSEAKSSLRKKGEFEKVIKT